MKNFTFLAAALLISSTASAGSFESWTMADKKAGAVTVVVSFQGDGVTQDAGVDLGIPEGYIVTKSVIKVAGSVCMSTDKFMRVVPPSGAGEALPKAAVDYCSFALRAKKGAVVSQSINLVPVFTECAAPTGIQSCGHADSAVN